MAKACTEHPSITTDVSRITLLPNEILDWQYMPDSEISLEIAQYESELIGRFMRDNGATQLRLLIDVRDIGSISRSARRHFASREVHDTYGILGLALLIGSPIGTMVGNLYFSLNRTLHPTRLFTERDAAEAWLRTL